LNKWFNTEFVERIILCKPIIRYSSHHISKIRTVNGKNKRLFHWSSYSVMLKFSTSLQLCLYSYYAHDDTSKHMHDRAIPFLKSRNKSRVCDKLNMSKQRMDRRFNNIYFIYFKHWKRGSKTFVNFLITARITTHLIVTLIKSEMSNKRPTNQK
jgi:hypothetical protein